MVVIRYRWLDPQPLSKLFIFLVEYMTSYTAKKLSDQCHNGWLRVVVTGVQVLNGLKSQD